MEGLEYLQARPAHCVATFRNVVFVFGSTPMTSTDLLRLDTALQERLREYPDGVGVLRWVPPGGGGPEEEVRQQVIELFKSLGDRLLGFATVLEGSGFWASGARSVLLDISRRSEFTAPLEVLDDADAGVQWLAERLGASESLADLRMAVARVKTRLAELGRAPS
ncbi:MAG: hypothetical protein AAF799_16390 [Myxococcota bacterium]